MAGVSRSLKFGSVVYERNKKLPAQSAGGRYKSNPHNGDMVL